MLFPFNIEMAFYSDGYLVSFIGVGYYHSYYQVNSQRFYKKSYKRADSNAPSGNYTAENNDQYVGEQ